MKLSLLLTLLTGASALVTEPASGQAPKTIYFVRHAEDELAVFRPGPDSKAFLPDCKPFMEGGLLMECCTEMLTQQGTNRAGLLLSRWEFPS